MNDHTEAEYDDAVFDDAVFDDAVYDDAVYDDLIRELQHAGELDPVPAEAVAAAQAAIIWRTIDAELAELTYDSVLDDDALAGVRGTEPSRMMTFEAPGLTVEVECLGAASPRRLVGQVVPPQPGQLTVRHTGGTTEVEVDELGRFMAEGIVPGAISLRYEGPAGTLAGVTDWVIV